MAYRFAHLSLIVRVCVCVCVCVYVKISAGGRVQSFENKFTIKQSLALDRGYNGLAGPPRSGRTASMYKCTYIYINI